MELRAIAFEFDLGAIAIRFNLEAIGFLAPKLIQQVLAKTST
ncbi:hypothetical protein [Microcoleus sp. Pol10D4]